MTPSNWLDEIKERERNATPGPWRSEWDGLAIKSVRAPDQTIIRSGFPGNSDFIAHAREDIPRLISEVERLEADLAKATDELRDAANLIDPRTKSKLEEENTRLREALEFYAKGQHFEFNGSFDDDGYPETVSGEPENFECGNGEFTYETGWIARQALGMGKEGEK